MSGETPPKKKRGAPPGNTNALKHGYYSPRFGPTCRRESLNLDSTEIVDQIALLRVYIRQVYELSDQFKNIHDLASRLRVLSCATGSLGRLITLHRLLPGTLDQKEIARAALIKAFSDLSAEYASSAPSGPSSAFPVNPPEAAGCQDAVD